MMWFGYGDALFVAGFVFYLVENGASPVEIWVLGFVVTFIEAFARGFIEAAREA